jgi:DNA-binding transcriptional regulator YiaG
VATVELERDREKNRINIAKHGWDFSDAIRLFLDPLFDGGENRSLDNGEWRHQATGHASHKLVTVVYTERNGLIRVISVYKPSTQQRSIRSPHSRVIRMKLGLTQEEFAARHHIPLRTLRDWEQHRSEPDLATRAYLKVIDREPDMVARALAEGRPAAAE